MELENNLKDLLIHHNTQPATSNERKLAKKPKKKKPKKNKCAEPEPCPCEAPTVSDAPSQAPTAVLPACEYYDSNGTPMDDILPLSPSQGSVQAKQLRAARQTLSSISSNNNSNKNNGIIIPASQQALGENYVTHTIGSSSTKQQLTHMKVALT